eukprot:CAMPEP_0206043326 /NCGR_PEP_ID=MMETSP1466-20131121/8585_1 /ASSEMBLY_ACC=CAM_ASM_001126 /TAXON_ID=44452 /ORGANISM="Pavlova gyrans, Strain CCMP608" /LENGTH=94 /DNA_ID=CAMNT_0053418123 /DNA_START=172 /DNA_END=456 /DNA_ORIENTATION=-
MRSVCNVSPRSHLVTLTFRAWHFRPRHVLLQEVKVKLNAHSLFCEGVLGHEQLASAEEVEYDAEMYSVAVNEDMAIVVYGDVNALAPAEHGAQH